MVLNPERCDVCKKACRTGNKFFKILIDGQVTRCFTNQEYAYSLLGDMSKSHNVKLLKDFSPCLSLDNKCRCLAGFNKLGQIEHSKAKTVEFYFCKFVSRIKFSKYYLKYYFYKIFKLFKPKLKLKQKKYKAIIDSQMKVYGY